MLKFRILTMVLLLAAMTGSAAAQNAKDATPGKPLSLLQLLLRPAHAQAKPHTRFAHRAAHRTTAKLANGGNRHRTRLAAHGDAPPATDAMSVSAWLADDASTSTTAPAVVTPAAPTAEAAVPASPETTSTPAPSEIAADEPHEVAAAPDGQAATPQAADAMIALAQQNDGDDAEQSWISELLATLGGALAAGSVAWLLIFRVPARQYE